MQEAKKYRPTGLKFTANDEEPDCMQCDHCWDDIECNHKCGPDYDWAGYIRTEWEEVKELK